MGSTRYLIAGNFHMVQNFAVFVDRSAAAKIRTMKFLSLSSANYGLSVGVSHQSTSVKLRTTKFLLKGWVATP